LLIAVFRLAKKRNVFEIKRVDGNTSPRHMWLKRSELQAAVHCQPGARVLKIDVAVSLEAASSRRDV
jgi:hypothetical protein